MLRTTVLGLTLAARLLPAGGGAGRPDVVLLTLDTTRADHVGRIVGGRPLTPALDALAQTGTRYARALAPAPLTLPAHCTLMTGRNPPEHGVRDNGSTRLPPEIPTLAEAFAARGYATGAFVSSLVLDRRFGLDRGFGVYDDALVAERTGEQGYPERDAAAVTDAALAWTSKLPPGSPRFLWVHYYDPHAPYQPPGSWTGASAGRRYAGEVAYMDREIGRLLASLPASPAGRIVAVVGDHGEMLGEHGEKEHGIFLYRAALEVPLILSGPGGAGRPDRRCDGRIPRPAGDASHARRPFRERGALRSGPAGPRPGGRGKRDDLQRNASARDGLRMESAERGDRREGGG